MHRLAWHSTETRAHRGSSPGALRSCPRRGAAARREPGKAPAELSHAEPVPLAKLQAQLSQIHGTETTSRDGGVVRLHLFSDGERKAEPAQGH